MVPTLQNGNVSIAGRVCLRSERTSWFSQIEDKVILKTSLGEYGRQRTSSKFHDLVLSLFAL